jgi:two-component system, chemotaxis family, sensor kinase CheA
VPSPDQEFLKKLRQAFAFEAKEQLQTISNALLELEQTAAEQSRKELVEVMFRQAHNLKGSARAVNMTHVESLLQMLESVFAAMKKDHQLVSTAAIDIFHRSVDMLEDLLAAEDAKVIEALSPKMNVLRDELGAIIGLAPTTQGAGGAAAAQAAPAAPAAAATGTGKGSGLHAAATAAEPAAVQAEAHQSAPTAVATAPERSATMESIKIPAAKLDAHLLQAEEMLAVKRAAVQHFSDVSALMRDAEEWDKEWQKIDVSTRDLRSLVTKRGSVNINKSVASLQKVIDFLEWNHSRVNSFVSRLKAQNKLVGDDMRATSLSIDTFLESTKQLLVMPCAVLFEVFPKMVRDVARDLGKDVQFTMHGTDVELDKRILAQIRDPLVHLIRNSIDHGIESPDARRQAGKPARANVTLTVSHSDAGMVEIQVSDDGGGINPEKVKAAAVKQGILTEAEAAALNREEAIDLIFASSLSTSPIITEISGRGLGLAIVRENIANLGGRLIVETELGAYTRFRMFLPMTIATFTAILLNVHGHIVALPKSSLTRVLRLTRSEISTVEARDVFNMDALIVPLVELADLLEIAPVEGIEEPEYLLVSVIAIGDDNIGLIVDDILEEQEVLVKGLGKPLNRVRNVSGVTVLRTGEAVPILNVTDLGKSARRVSGKKLGSVARKDARQKKKVLVVDDTMTSRMLMKNIMEAAGYITSTATNGAEALAALGQDHFDLVCTDVEMPRMTGLELCKRIRQDQKLAEIPVILLTSLASKEDRERGVEAGANAYFVKSSSFDQANLLEVVKRLI